MLAEARRLDMLAAMGVDVYRLRGGAAVTVAQMPAFAESGTEQDIAGIANGHSAVEVVVVCARGVRHAVNHARLFSQLPRVLGVAASAIGWLEAAADGSLATPPQVAAYVVIGPSLTHAFGVQLSTRQQSAAIIAVCAEPGDLIRDVAAKRMWWQALKPVVRRLRQSAG